MKYQPILIKENGHAIIEDAHLLAALLTFDPSLRYSLTWNASGRVVFDIRGPISDGMRRYYSGEQAPLVKYSENLKLLKSSIHALRTSCREQRSAVQQRSATRVLFK